MVSSKVAKRYAQGLLQFTQDAGSTDTVFAEMKTLVNTINGSRELQSFLASPVIDVKKKTAAAAAIFKNLSPVSQNLIYLVIKQGRESQLAGIGNAFVNKVEDMRGVQRVTVTSAAPLAEENIQKILSSAALVNLNNKYEVTSVVNPEILGGYILRVGDQQVDASVRTKLERLKKEFQLN